MSTDLFNEVMSAGLPYVPIPFRYHCTQVNFTLGQLLTTIQATI